MPRRDSRARERGFITVATMFVLIIVMGLMLTLLSSSLTARKSIALHETRAQGLELAEMALIHSEMEFRGQSDPNGDGIGNVLDQLDTGDMLSGTFRVDATPVASQPSLYKLVATGTQGLSTRKLEVGLLVSKPFEFKHAIAAAGSLIVNDAASTDAYDSRLGSWAAQAVNSDTAGAFASTMGHVGSNQGVDVYDNAMVRGDGRAGPSYTTQAHSLEATVTGDSSARTTALALPAPSQLEFEHALDHNHNDSMQVMFEVSYDSVNRDLAATGSGTVTLAAGTYFFNDFTFDDNAQLALDGPVRIYVTGELRFTSAAQITYNYGNYQPRGLRIIAHPYALTPGSMPTGAIQFKSAMTATLTLYAPARNVLIDSAANISGAIAGNNVQLNTHAQVHYDLALGVSGSGMTETAILYWRDLNPPSY